MKKYVILLIMATFSPCFAQKSGWTLGYQVNRFQDDFGLGVQIATPKFWKNSALVRVSVDNQWLSHVNDAQKNVWTNYQDIKVGFAGFSPEISKGIRIYGEGGNVLLLPKKSLGVNNPIVGGYGVFGFEFGFNRSQTYIELGGIGTGAVAEKLPQAPIFANGFLISTGFRFQL